MLRMPRGFSYQLVSQSRRSEVEMKIVDDSPRIRSERTASGYLGVADELRFPMALSTPATWSSGAATAIILSGGLAASSMSAG
jgi:hypothetical protein